MANKKTILQAIADFDSIEKAIEECGVDVPHDTDTSEYGNYIRRAVDLAGRNAAVDTTNFATKDELSLKADDVLFIENIVVGSGYGAFKIGDSLQNMKLREIISKILNVTKVISGIDEIIMNEIPMLSGSEDGVTATIYAYMAFTSEEAAKAPTTSVFYQIVDDGVVSETGYQIITESTGRKNYAIALPEGITIVDVLMWDEPTSTWVDYTPVFIQTGTTTVDGCAYTIYTSADSSSGETLRFIIE